MSKYKIKCHDCEGSGGVPKDNAFSGLDAVSYHTGNSDTCPTCNGSGKMGLFVRCENAGDGGCEYSEQGKCSCNGGLRPLSVDEVLWLAGKFDFTFKELVDKVGTGIDEQPVLFKGKPVTIGPLEG